MKIVSRMVLVGVLAICMMAGVASAKNIICEVVSMCNNDTISTVLINCAPDAPIKKGDKIKVKVQKAKTPQIEGC